MVCASASSSTGDLLNDSDETMSATTHGTHNRTHSLEGDNDVFALSDKESNFFVPMEIDPAAFETMTPTKKTANRCC